jgi:hypothetical protein
MRRHTRSLVIASGTSLSPATDLGAQRLQGIQMPAAWDAANLTFQGSADGVTYNDVYDSAGEHSVTAAASRMIMVDAEKFRAIRYLKVRSGTTGVAVNQTADRTLTLVTVPIGR